MERHEVRTSRRAELVDVTRQVAATVASSGIAEGAVLVYCPHTTAGVTVNENADPDVGSDILHGLGKLVPEHGGWRHAEGNADAHVKAALVGSSAMVPVSGGRLVLGTWQGIYLCEFDGPRTRGILVRVLPA